MTNDITIKSIKSNYDGNNVTRTVDFSLGGDEVVLIGVATGKNGVWTDNDGKPGLSDGDIITIGDENVPWNDLRAVEMAAKAEEEYKAFLEWKDCVVKTNNGSDARNSSSAGSGVAGEYKCDRNGNFLPDLELEIGQSVSSSECKLLGDVMLTRKNDKPISLVRSDESWLFKQVNIGVDFNMPAGIVYDPLMLGVQPKGPQVTKIEITGESHPDLKGLEPIARSVSDAYVQNGKEACKERRDICTKLWGTEDFTERINILRENGGFDLFDQCVEMK